MLTKSLELSRAQQKKLKIQAKWGSSLALMIWKGFLTNFHRNLARFISYFQALQQQEDSSIEEETRLQKVHDKRFMDLQYNNKKFPGANDQFLSR